MTTQERRATVRRMPEAGEPEARLRLRTGHELRVLDISDQGARVEGEARLLPGTGVEVHMITATGRICFRSRVLRSQVCRVTADAISYQSALSFEPIQQRTA